MSTSPWLQKIARPKVWAGRLVLAVTSLLVLLFTFVVVFPWLGFVNTSVFFLWVGVFSAFVSSWLLGARFRQAVARRGALHFIWLGPCYSWLTAQLMAFCSMLLYTLEQQLDPNARDGNPIFGLVTLVLFYTPSSLLLGLFGGLWLRYWLRDETFSES
jgi:hypothetical protein